MLIIVTTVGNTCDLYRCFYILGLKRQNFRRSYHWKKKKKEISSGLARIIITSIQVEKSDRKWAGNYYLKADGVMARSEEAEWKAPVSIKSERILNRRKAFCFK